MERLLAVGSAIPARFLRRISSPPGSPARRDDAGRHVGGRPGDECACVPSTGRRYLRGRRVTDPHAGLADLIEVVRAEARKLGRDDLAALLPAPPGPRETLRRPRIVVCGGPSRGKSRLVNSLLGRPGLSPVGSRPTTGGWLEFRHGAEDSLTALLTDPTDRGTPRRVPIPPGELHAYAVLNEISAPVLGVDARLDAPVLRDLVL